MPARLIYEVMRRTTTGFVEVGSVTDDFIAKQVIDRLYEELRQQAGKPEGQMALAEAGFEAYDIQNASQDWDTWSVNNRNSPTPYFFARKRMLWNSVPSTILNWGMGESGDNFSFFAGDVPNASISTVSKPTVTNG